MNWLTKIGISWIIVVFFAILLSVADLSSFDTNILSMLLGFGITLFVLGKDNK